MKSAPPYLVDTNIFLRLMRTSDPHYDVVRNAIGALIRQGSTLHYSLQTIAEFWNVCTRPADRNGFGFDISEVAQRVAAIERRMTLLPDNQGVYRGWRHLVEAHQVKGVQVHYARLVALMNVHTVKHIVTLNQTDFVRYPSIVAVHPKDLKY